MPLSAAAPVTRANTTRWPVKREICEMAFSVVICHEALTNQNTTSARRVCQAGWLCVSGSSRACEGTAAMYEEEFREKGIRLVMELTDEPVGVVADAQQIRQALINIISNSEQAMEKSGGKELYMRTRLDREGGRAVVEISDTGGGIPAEILENIFNPFFTTKVKGTGLGLAITNKIVKNHGGEVEVVNREGAGASFIIRLPLHETEQGGA